MGLYDSETQEGILNRLIGRVQKKVDKREGSFIHDALAPTSIEIKNNYIAIDIAHDESFADTASRENLIRRCAERGITPKPASYAIVQGEFTPSALEIPIGSRFSHEDLNYIIIKKIDDGVYQLQCEMLGSEANGVTGQLIPISYVPGLETAKITEVLIPGDDEEDTEVLRSRYFASFKSEAFGGNQQDYLNKLREIPGVGGCKVYSGAEWNGGGTVLCVIQDSELGVPTDDFIADIQEIIDPEMNCGEGKGVAPIGHFVAIVPVNETTIDLNVALTFEKNATWETVQYSVESAVDEYLNGLNKQWQDRVQIVVRIAHIESALLDIPGILDVQNTTINGLESNLIIDKNSIVKRGVINGN